MHLQRIILRLVQYNLWANERLTAYLVELDHTLLYKVTGSSFGTIDRTLQHLLSAETYWHDLIVHGKINEFNLSIREHAAKEVIADLVKSSHKLISSFTAFNEQQLTDRIQASDSHQ